MRGFVTGMFWFAQAFSAAIAQAFVGLSSDPLLVWLYTTVAIISILVRISAPQSPFRSTMTTKPLIFKGTEFTYMHTYTHTLRRPRKVSFC